jgi:hypothetical protein
MGVIFLFFWSSWDGMAQVYFRFLIFSRFLVKNNHFQEKSAGVKRCPNNKIFDILPFWIKINSLKTTHP